MEEERREREERIEKSEKMKAGWNLAKLCSEYIKENSNSWRGEEQERKKKKQKEREREAQKDKALEMQKATKSRLTQKKITDILRKVPYMEQSKVLEDDQKQRRFQMKEMKENLWKWRGGKQQRRAEEETEEQKLNSLEII